MLPFDEKIIEEKGQDLKIHPSVKCTYCKYIPLQNLLIAHHCLSLQNMSNKMAARIINRDQISQCQVGYMSCPVLNQNIVFKYQVKKHELRI